MEGRAAQVGLPASPPRASAPVPVPMSERYDGNPDHCQVFLMQCGLFIKEHLESLWMDDSPLLDSARNFQQAFKGIFDYPSIGRNLRERLEDFCQLTVC
uniref:Uncharacterized protein n=1 Tax=Paramormyrops kingsleyae TaxID=1676925 RepID=A0A3B3RHE9_9TELE